MPKVGREPVKDEDRAHPVADAWRHVLRDIVGAFVEGDYGLCSGIASVAPVSTAMADHIKANIEDYGEVLTELPNEAWDTSVSQWTGTHWEVLVDLWTAESGQGDLVLSLRVMEVGDGYRFAVDSVYVP